MAETSSRSKMACNPSIFQLQQVCTFQPSAEAALVFLDTTASQSHLLILRENDQVELVDALLDLGSTNDPDLPSLNPVSAHIPIALDKLHVDVSTSPTDQSQQQPNSSILHTMITASAADNVEQLFYSNHQDVSGYTGVPIPTTTHQFSLRHTGHLRQLKLSPDRMFIGVLRSAKSFEIRLTLASPNEPSLLEIERDWRFSDAILGFEWSFSGEFVLITSTGIELYRYSEKRGIFLKSKIITGRISWYLFSADANILITCSGALALTIHHLKPNSYIVMLPSLRLDNYKSIKFSTTRAPGPVVIIRKHIHVVNLYGHVYIMFSNTWSETPIMHLFQLKSQKTWIIAHSLDLIDCGVFTHSIWDNILIVHNSFTKTSLLFDIFSNHPSKLLVEPQKRLFKLLDSKLAVDEGQHTSWACHQPDLVLLPTAGILSRLSLQCRELRDEMECCGQQNRGYNYIVDILQMLSRRTDPSAYILKLETIKSLISQHPDLTYLRQAFDTLNQTSFAQGSTLAKHSYDSRLQHIQNIGESCTTSISDPFEESSPPCPFSNVSLDEANRDTVNDSSKTTSAVQEAPCQSPGYFSPRLWKRKLQQVSLQNVIDTSQDDMYTVVFRAFIKENPDEALYFSSCLLEYMSSLAENKRFAEPSIEELLVQTLFDCGKMQQVYQMVHFGVVRQSIKIAHMVMQHQSVFPAFFGLAMRIFESLNADEDAVFSLIQNGKLIEAAKYVLDRKCTQLLPVYTLLDAAYVSNDHTLFLNIYRIVEEYAYTHTDDRVDHALGQLKATIAGNGRVMPMSSVDENALNRFVSVYRELWEPRLNMETLQGEL